jgi:hypothetical protein
VALPAATASLFERSGVLHRANAPALQVGFHLTDEWSWVKTYRCEILLEVTMSQHVPRRPDGRREYLIDFIPDRQLYCAVMFALRMIREGTPPGLAIWRAASYYRREITAVAHYVGQAGGTCSGRRR